MGPPDFIVSVNKCCYVKMIFVEDKIILKPLSVEGGRWRTVGTSKSDIVVSRMQKLVADHSFGKGCTRRCI